MYGRPLGRWTQQPGLPTGILAGSLSVAFGRGLACAGWVDCLCREGWIAIYRNAPQARQARPAPSSSSSALDDDSGVVERHVGVAGPLRGVSPLRAHWMHRAGVHGRIGANTRPIRRRRRPRFCCDIGEEGASPPLSHCTATALGSRTSQMA
jgi:hypothetical protein